MAERAITPAGVPQTYAQLRRGVEETLLKGQRAIEHAKLLTYHETGRLINEHVFVNGARADYGSQVVSRLARDLDLARTTLYQCTQFARYFPIVRRGGQFNWAQYRVLCQVEDDSKRLALVAAAIQHAWTTDQIIAEVRAWNAAPTVGPASDANSAALSSVEAPDLLKPIRGTPGLHLIVERASGLAVDLGFKLYWPLTPDQAKRFSKGDIVRIASDDSLRKVEDATKADLFTYDATLVRVIDGDTIVVELEVSPGVTHELKLRLRGLDCPEISTAPGRAAKRFVNDLLPPGTAVVLSTTKPDKYDRYLADIFVGSDPETFLNNTLLEAGYAVHYDGGAKEE